MSHIDQHIPSFTTIEKKRKHTMTVREFDNGVSIRTRTAETKDDTGKRYAVYDGDTQVSKEVRQLKVDGIVSWAEGYAHAKTGITPKVGNMTEGNLVPPGNYDITYWGDKGREFVVSKYNYDVFLTHGLFRVTEVVNTDR